MSIKNNAYTLKQLTWAWRIHRIVTYPADFLAGVCYFYIQMSTYMTRRYLGIAYHKDTLWTEIKFQWKCRHSWDGD